MRIMPHNIAIPTILAVGKGTLHEIGFLLAQSGFRNVVLFFDAYIFEILGAEVIKALESAGIVILQQYRNDETAVCGIVDRAFLLPAQTEVIIGIGGGRVIDVAKYTAFLNNLPYISFPTSTAHDGFASSGCSLYVSGRRTSAPAKMPFGIIVDLEVVKNAPDRFIYSGIGDLISKITAIYDWEFEEQNGKAVVNDFAAMIGKKSVNSVVRTEFCDIKEDFFLKELVDSLTLSGIAMEIAGSSAPASGSEHLISHALDKFLEKPQLHGIQVGVATYLMSKVQGHRYQRVTKFLRETGFFAYVRELGMKAADFAQAIEIAPTIKPHRYTYIHLPENRRFAQSLLREDEILREILA